MITKTDVENIANLSKLELGKKEVNMFVEQLNTILDYMKELDELDLTGTEASFYLGEFENVFRKDKVEQSFDSNQATINTQSKENNFFKTPKVII